MCVYIDLLLGSFIFLYLFRVRVAHSGSPYPITSFSLKEVMKTNDE